MSITPTSPSTSGVAPNFTDYDDERSRFSWSAIERRLGPAPGGCNIAYYAVDRHDCGPQRDKVAFRFVGPNKGAGELPVTEVTFGDFAHRVRKFTAVLRGLGVGKGDPVFVFTGRIPELYVSILGGALRNGSVVSPLFSAFGPEPLATRLRLGDAQVLVTTEQLYRRRVEKIRDSLPSLRHVLVVGGCRFDHRRSGHARLPQHDGGRRRGLRYHPRPAPTMLPCYISPAERPVPRRARSMSTAPWPPIMRPGCSPWTCIHRTYSGARRILAGSPARRTG